MLTAADSRKSEAATAWCTVISGTGRSSYAMIAQGSMRADPVIPLNVPVEAKTKHAIPL